MAVVEKIAGLQDAEPCFHCGLPVPEGSCWDLDIHGAATSFCCPGCREVCRTIFAAGLGNYYQLRDRPAPPLLPEGLAVEAQTLELYDDPRLQASFTTPGQPWQEAALLLEGIRCPACLWLNEQRLRGLAGVLEAHVDYTSQRLRVRWDQRRISLSHILRAVARLGYRAEPYDPAQRDALLSKEKRRGMERLIFAAATGMAIMHFSLAVYLTPVPDAATGLPQWVVIGRWTSFVLATAILAFSGQDFFVGAFQDLRHRRLGMDVPITLGLLVAYAGSVAATLQRHGEVYYDSIAMFVCLVLAARHFELRARLTAADTIDQLTRVVPTTARRLMPDGREQNTFVYQVSPGDRLRVGPGERVPVDGRIIQGASRFDESLLSGEALPVARGPGDEVMGGARNWEQTVTLEVTRIAQDSTIMQLTRLMQASLADKPHCAQLADRLARWLVPAVMLVAGITAVVWLRLDASAALANTVAVLIVTCPCALALATPAVMALSARKLVALGVMPLRMSAIEELAHGGVWAFDKTGTLTAGRLELQTITRTGPLASEKALRIAAALESASTHPIAMALQKACPAPSLTVGEPQYVAGTGVRGVIEGQHWWFGKPGWMTAATAGGTAPPERLRGPEKDEDLTAMLGNEHGIQACFRFSDQLRPGLPALLEALRQQRVKRLVMLSGDNQARLSRLGAKLGFDEALGGLSPQEKLSWVRRQQCIGQRVFMVGDGMNDAPVLGAANVALSFREATDLAQSASDFLLLTNDIGVIAKLRPLAQQTRRILIQNLAWAGGYNLLMIPAAAVGLIPPWGAAIGMSASSLLVVANALRLSTMEQPVAANEAPRQRALSSP
ncbi:MAG: heavy metal translocating P-type ATPase [Gammaproteobacteria bacterium]